MTDMDGRTGDLAANQGTDAAHSADSTGADVQKLLTAINDRLTQLEGQQRALQSGKDKGIAGLQDEFQKFKGNFAEILEYGKRYSDPVEAERNWRLDQLLQTAGGGVERQQVSQEGSGVAARNQNAEVPKELLEQYGVDPMSEAYQAQLAQGKSSLEATLAVLASKSTAPQDGVASGVSGGTSGSTQIAAEQRQAALRAEYNAELDRLQKANGGYLTPNMLYQTQQKFADKGLEVW